MLDPIPPPPEWLREWTRPWAERANLHSLPEHIHEVLLFYLFYQFVHSCASPWLSRKFLPQYYTNLPRRTQINWDTHVVSFIQSTSVVLVALWVMVADKERKAMASDGWEEGHPRRMYGYTGACGLVQAMAVGYFVYDLIVSTVYVRITGVGMVFHAISALTVYALGFVSDSFPSSLAKRKRGRKRDCGLGKTNSWVNRDLSSTSTRPRSSYTNSPPRSSISIGSWTRST